MIFGDVPVADAEGLILAHSVRLPGGAFKKGRVLSGDDIRVLQGAQIETVSGARLEPDDVGEDEAAETVARAVCGPGLTLGDAFTGRCNIFAEGHGLAVIDSARVNQLNLLDEAMTLGTVAPHALVEAGKMVATVKVIPFAAARARRRALRRDRRRRWADAAIGTARGAHGGPDPDPPAGDARERARFHHGRRRDAPCSVGRRARRRGALRPQPRRGGASGGPASRARLRRHPDCRRVRHRRPPRRGAGRRGGGGGRHRPLRHAGGPREPAAAGAARRGAGARAPRLRAFAQAQRLRLGAAAHLRGRRGHRVRHHADGGRAAC